LRPPQVDPPDLVSAAGDTDATILALQVLGLALAGSGRYDEASRSSAARPSASRAARSA
jgi:hypothetical protein